MPECQVIVNEFGAREKRGAVHSGSAKAPPPADLAPKFAVAAAPSTDMDCEVVLEGEKPTIWEDQDPRERVVDIQARVLLEGVGLYRSAGDLVQAFNT